MENYYIVYVNDVPMTKPISHGEAYNYAYDHADDGYIWIRQVNKEIQDDQDTLGKSSVWNDEDAIN